MHTTNFLLFPSLDSEGPKHLLQILVRLAGIEPTTPWFVAKYSIQLSYSRLRSRIISHEFRFGKLTFCSTFRGETGVSGSFLRSILCKEAALYAGVSGLSSVAKQFLSSPTYCLLDIITSFMKRISLIMNGNWIFMPRCSIIHLSPLFSSKKIEFRPAELRAFFFAALGVALPILISRH